MPDAIDQFLGFKKEIVSDAVGLMLVILVAVGLRTRLCAVILIIWLGTVFSIFHHFYTQVLYTSVFNTQVENMLPRVFENISFSRSNFDFMGIIIMAFSCYYKT